MFLINSFTDKKADIFRCLGIIQLGDHAGSKQSKERYPKELVSQTNRMMKMDKLDAFERFNSFYKQFFDSLAVSIDDGHRFLARNYLVVSNTNDHRLPFVFQLLMIFTTQILKSPDVLSKQESIFNYRAVFRFFDAVVSVTPQYVFYPGETRLQAINHELKRQGLSSMNYYNADGIVADTHTGLEIVLLETSGPFGLVDITRETSDHIKAAYGLLSMLHTVAYTYIYADLKLFQKLKICFIHAFKDRIRLWSFSLVGNELYRYGIARRRAIYPWWFQVNRYVLNRVGSAIVPVSCCDTFESSVKDLGNLFWKLKVLLDDASSVLKLIKDSHDKNEAAYLGGLNDDMPRLDSVLVDNAEVKISSRVANADDLHISSSPIQPDSP